MNIHEVSEISKTYIIEGHQIKVHNPKTYHIKKNRFWPLHEHCKYRCFTLTENAGRLNENQFRRRTLWL